MNTKKEDSDSSSSMESAHAMDLSISASSRPGSPKYVPSSIPWMGKTEADSDSENDVVS